MERSFWEEMWAERDQPGFHQSEINRHLRAHHERVRCGRRGGRVLVPLCGKSRDMTWLMERFEHVVGVELVDKPVRAWFEEHGVPFERREEDHLVRYEGEGITLLCGDFLEVRREDVGPVDCVYDRAALIALPPEQRRAYAAHVADLLEPGARSLLLTMAYDQERVDGPPFSVQDDEVWALYGEGFDVECLERDRAQHMPPRFEDMEVTLSVWLMIRREATARRRTEAERDPRAA
ncbi:MAG: thiopurine S-methyltransferase [Myxococcota bacterium]